MPDASERENDPSIDDSAELYLRIRPEDVTSDDCDVGEYRPGSGTLRRDEPLSVDLASLSTPQQTQQRAGGDPFHVAKFTAGIARRHGCRVRRDPLPENDAHALVIGDHKYDTGSLSKSQMKQIARQARIIFWDNRIPRPC